MVEEAPEFGSSYILVNCSSGRYEGRRLLGALKKRADLQRRGFEIEELQRTRVAEQIDRAFRHDRIFIAGGDGTIHHLLPLLTNSDKLIGIIPLGVGNDLAREFGVSSASKDDCEAFDQYRTVRESRLTVWRFADDTGRSLLFCNYLGFGFEGRVVERFAEMRLGAVNRLCGGSRLGKRAMYLAAGIRHLTQKLPAEFSVHRTDGKQPQPVAGSASLLFTNIGSYMGLGVSTSRADPGDDLLECLQLASPLAYLGILLGKEAQLLGSSSRWTVKCASPVSVQADGEPLSSFSGEGQLSEAGSIRLLLPKSSRTR